MTATSKRSYLVAEKATLEHLVARLPAESILERVGLEHRLGDVTAELAILPASSGRTAESELAFYGGPVRGSEGIDGMFTAS
jgi:hypothetical protein